MPIHYKDVVPWGRNYSEYVRMFSLLEADLDRSIIGCGDGPASFNAEAHQQGRTVISLDPIYRFSRAKIQERINKTYDAVLNQTRTNMDKFVWDSIHSPAELGRIRMEAMERFLSDYDLGRSAGRYIPGSLPELPFKDGQFDLALCSHLLFLYSDNLSFDFHLKSLLELLRVAREVRVFPLVDVNTQRSRHLDGILSALARYRPEIQRVNYEFQRGGNAMLRLQASV